ncbi:PLC-like phosphodiesterase [Xylariaceae sp. FL0594]|nr:PLC-like phosphodiesterase [Xylariaceae sp. FL0594]
MRLTNGAVSLVALGAALVVATDDGAQQLGQFALQKLLKDGRDVFGDYVDADMPPSTSSYPSTNYYANWMAGLPDSIPLSQLNIPGTHDAATWNYTQETQESLRYATRCDGTVPAAARAYRCQRASVAEALSAGVRFLDLRFALDPADSRLVFWHSAALLSDTAGLEDVLFGMYAWLEAHPTEALVLSLQYERGTKAGATSDARVQRMLWDALVDSAAARRYVWQGRGVVPTLGEVRGKILLFRRFDLDALKPANDYEGKIPGLHMSPTKWLDNKDPGFELVYNETTNATAYIEDYYYPTPHLTIEGNIEAKWKVVTEHLQKAAQGDYDSLFVTFTSGTHVDIIPPVYPEVMALGPGAGSSHTPRSKSKIKTKAKSVDGINDRLHDFLQGMKGKRLGIVVMDFFEEPDGLIDLLLDF